MTPRIVDVREVTKPISSPIRNAYIDFSKMTSSLVAVVTNIQRERQDGGGVWLQLEWPVRPGGIDPGTVRAACPGG